jgi:hypothetical protein
MISPLLLALFSSYQLFKSQRNSLFFVVTHKYRDISTNTWSENILFYQHPYNKIARFVQIRAHETGKLKLICISNNKIALLVCKYSNFYIFAVQFWINPPGQMKVIWSYDQIRLTE